jgi:hypothetical protein
MAKNDKVFGCLVFVNAAVIFVKSYKSDNAL